MTEFLKKESAGGIILMAAALLAIVLANSPAYGMYQGFLQLPVAVQIGSFSIAKPLLLWINDGLMAVFFFLVGLELKRELLAGELADPRNVLLPAVGAVGGMAAPALVYLWINQGDPSAQSGWAIPAATDIAFALGILSLLGSRVPVALKVFLTSLAIFDDLGAIVIIALFYTSKLSMLALVVAAICIALLTLLNKKGVMTKSPYMLVGLIMWVALLKSGVHATLAGVILALFIPIKGQMVNDEGIRRDVSPLRELEHDLHHVVAFFVLPVFAFANAGLNLTGVTIEQALHGVPLGIAAGLFVGKQLGIFVLCALTIKLGLARLPNGMDWRSLYATAVLCGVGFTMSLFIGSLAFEQTGVDRMFDERLGIIAGSLVSGVMGYLLLKWWLPKQPTEHSSSSH